MIDDCGDEVLFAGEVVVELALAGLGVDEDLVEARRGHAAGEHQAGGGAHDALAAGEATGGQPGRWDVTGDHDWTLQSSRLYGLVHFEEGVLVTVRLNNGDIFPVLDIPAVGGGSISLPGDLAGSFGVVLVYRGSWCPYCNAQLTSFARAGSTWNELGVRVVAFSADAEPAATAIVDKHQLGFPVGYGADVDIVADALGSYTNDEPHFLQSTGFLLAPDGRVILASYSSGAIGRLTADDVAGLFRYLASKG